MNEKPRILIIEDDADLVARYEKNPGKQRL